MPTINVVKNIPIQPIIAKSSTSTTMSRNAHTDAIINNAPIILLYFCFDCPAFQLIFKDLKTLFEKKFFIDAIQPTSTLESKKLSAGTLSIEFSCSNLFNVFILKSLFWDQVFPTEHLTRMCRLPSSLLEQVL